MERFIRVLWVSVAIFMVGMFTGKKVSQSDGWIPSASADDRSEPGNPPAPVPAPEVDQAARVELEVIEPAELPIGHRLRTLREVREIGLFPENRSEAVGWVLIADIRRGKAVTVHNELVEALYIRADAPVFRTYNPAMPAVAVWFARGVLRMDFGQQGAKYEWPGPRDFYVCSDGQRRTGVEEYFVSSYEGFAKDLLPGSRSWKR